MADQQDMNKIIGREIAVVRVKAKRDDKGKLTLDIPNPIPMTVDPVSLALAGVPEESIYDCIKQLEKVGTFEELCEKFGNRGEGEQYPGLVVKSTKDPRVSLVADFGSKWSKDSDAQFWNAGPMMTLKWFADVDGMGKEMGPESPAERAVSDKELNLIDGIRAETATPEAKSESAESKATSLLHEDAVKINETGEPDQDYDHEIFDAICAALAPLECSHQEFDKYQGVYIAVSLDGKAIDKLWVKDSHVTGAGSVSPSGAVEYEGTPSDVLVLAPESEFDAEFSVVVSPDHKVSGDIEELKHYLMQKGSKMESKNLKVDQFGIPMFEDFTPVKDATIIPETPEKKEKEVEKADGQKSMDTTDVNKAGEPIAKPETVADIGVKSGQTELPDAAVKVGDPGEDSGKAVEGDKKASDDQQTELPAKEVKVGKPGDDSGKVMGESEILKRACEIMIARGKRVEARQILSVIKESVAKRPTARKLTTEQREKIRKAIAERIAAKKAAPKTEAK